MHGNNGLIGPTRPPRGVMEAADAATAVAGVATGQQDNEGGILRYGFWHAIGLGCLMGVLVFLQSNLLSWMIPR